MAYREPTLTPPRAPSRGYRWPLHLLVVALLAIPVLALWRDVLWPPPAPQPMSDGYAMSAGILPFIALGLTGAWVLYVVVTSAFVRGVDRARDVLTLHLLILGGFALVVLVSRY